MDYLHLQKKLDYEAWIKVMENAMKPREIGEETIEEKGWFTHTKRTIKRYEIPYQFIKNLIGNIGVPPGIFAEIEFEDGDNDEL